jgi:hypothetical protein
MLVWDFALFAETLRLFRARLQERYHSSDNPSTIFVIRTSPATSFCVRPQFCEPGLMAPIALENRFDYRGYTPMRIERYNQETMAAFADFPGRHYFLYPTMGGMNRFDNFRIPRCRNGHSRFDHVGLEVQHLLQMLC